MSEKYDVIIVGAGLIGLTTALGLSQRGLQIALIDSKAPQKTALSTDIRTLAITPASQQLFARLGVWPLIAAEKMSAYHHMHVWDAISQASLDFSCLDIGTENLGTIVETAAIETALWQRIDTCDDITVLAPVRPVTVMTMPDTAEITLTEQKRLQAKLIIGADGGNSWVRNAVNLTGHVSDYGQMAIAATCQTEKKHQQTAWQRFLPTGPLAFLPLADPHTCSIVWSTSPTQAEMLMHLPLDAFNTELTQAFEARLGAVSVVSQRQVFPLKRHYAKDFVAERVALVGDAAHSVHPLAGQGINLGLQDAAELLDILIKTLLKGRDIGAEDTLRRYARARKSDTFTLLAGIELIHRLFSQSNPWLAEIRGMGLRITDKIPLLKRGLIYYAMGFRR